ncbi:transposase [Crenothrix sp.]|uniref:transposase n=1 Tax=Crenothrix sp. TaxID=3100433 RepID=UPI00374DD35C
MTYNPAIHHRRSIRLKNYDYSQAGAYFVTICQQNRDSLFGHIANDNMVLNPAGNMVMRWYLELENKFPDIQCDACICMPNHIHFIVVNVGADLRVRPECDVHPECVARPESATNEDTKGEHVGSPLHRVVQWFKTMTTNEYIREVNQNQWPRFEGKLWQRNYWEHVVRNEADLERLREYIANNPKSWALDKLYEENQYG